MTQISGSLSELERLNQDVPAQQLDDATFGWLSSTHIVPDDRAQNSLKFEFSATLARLPQPADASSSITFELLGEVHKIWIPPLFVEKLHCLCYEIFRM